MLEVLFYHPGPYLYHNPRFGAFVIWIFSVNSSNLVSQWKYLNICKFPVDIVVAVCEIINSKMFKNKHKQSTKYSFTSIRCTSCKLVYMMYDL